MIFLARRGKLLHVTAAARAIAAIAAASNWAASSGSAAPGVRLSATPLGLNVGPWDPLYAAKHIVRRWRERYPAAAQGGRYPPVAVRRRLVRRLFTTGRLIRTLASACLTALRHRHQLTPAGLTLPSLVGLARPGADARPSTGLLGVAASCDDAAATHRTGVKSLQVVI